MRSIKVLFAFFFLLSACAEKAPEKTEVSDSRPFPRVPCTTVRVHWIDRNSDEDEKSVSSMSYLDGNEATGFIDSTGKPIHSRITATTLDSNQVRALGRVFRPLRQPDVDTVSPSECSPVYRDAIVYYDSRNAPVTWANICFSCEEIMFVPESPYVYGFSAGEQNLELRDFFKRLGRIPEGRP